MAYDVAFGFCFCLFCLCLCLPECQCRKTKAMSDNDNDNDSGNGNNKSVTMIIKATGRWPCCQVVKHSGTRHNERRNEPIIKTNAPNLHRTHN